MCIHNITSKYRRLSSYHYRKSTPETATENLLNRDFNTDHINEKWCTDVTGIKVPGTNDKLYISPVLDLCDRYPVSLCISDRNDTILTDESLTKAHEVYPETTNISFRQRVPIYRAVFKAKLESFEMTQSMSRVSRCIDNGPCEQYQVELKEILSVLYPRVKTKEEMIEAILKANDCYISQYSQKRFNEKQRKWSETKLWPAKTKRITNSFKSENHQVPETYKRTKIKRESI